MSEGQAKLEIMHEGEDHVVKFEKDRKWSLHSWEERVKINQQKTAVKLKRSTRYSRLPFKDFLFF